MNQLSEQAHQRTQLGMAFMLGAFVLALALTVMTFIVLRRTVIHPLLRAAQRIEQISAGISPCRRNRPGAAKLVA